MNLDQTGEIFRVRVVREPPEGYWYHAGEEYDVVDWAPYLWGLVQDVTALQRGKAKGVFTIFKRDAEVIG